MNNHFFLLKMLRGYNKPGSDNEYIDILKEAIKGEYNNLSNDKKIKFSSYINTLNSDRDIVSLWNKYTDIIGEPNQTPSEIQKNLEAYKRENNQLKLIKHIGLSLVPTIRNIDSDVDKLKDYISDKFLEKIKNLYESINKENNKSKEYFKTNDSSELKNIQVDTNDSIADLQKELSRLSVLQKNLEVITDPSKKPSSLFIANYNHGVYLITQKQSSDYIKHILYSIINNMIDNYFVKYINENLLLFSLLDINMLNIIYKLFNQYDFNQVIKGISTNFLHPKGTVNNISNILYSTKLHNEINILINNFDLKYNNFVLNFNTILQTLRDSLPRIASATPNNLYFYISSELQTEDLSVSAKVANVIILINKINSNNIFNQFMILIKLLEEFQSNFDRIKDNSIKLLNLASVEPDQSIQNNTDLTEIFKANSLDPSSKDLDWMANRSILSNVMDDLSDLIKQAAEDVKDVRSFSNMCINPNSDEKLNNEKKYLKYKNKYLKLKEF